MTLTKDRAHQIASTLTAHTLAYIDGAFAPASDGATFLTLNPATGADIAAVAHCGSADVDRAVVAARRVFDAGTWSRATPEKRKEVMIRLTNLVRAFASESNLKVVGLEMGVKSPFIVLEDAHLTDKLIEHAAMSAFLNGGQNCSANLRQIVAASLAEELAARVTTRTCAFKLGDPLDPETDIGAMVTSKP